jgi:predicted flap endonuclease-1-like 5' DNA nuclease
MTTSITKLRGMIEGLDAKMKEHGIYNSDQLLDAAGTPSGRKELAARLGVEPRDILEMANRADLSRVRGIGGVFSDLLEQAGVDTVKELATRRPDHLHKKLVLTNAEQRLAGRVPTLEMVQGWVAQAKELPRSIEY